MGLFVGREREVRAVFPEPPIAPFPGADAGGQVSVSSKPDMALTIPTVWACVSLLAGSVSSLPMETFRRNADPIAVPKRIADPKLIMAPDGDMTQSEWLHMLMVSLLMRGNAYGLIQRDGQLLVTGVHLLDPDRVTLKVETGGTLTYKLKNGSGVDRVIPPQDMWHVRGLTLPGSVVGLSPISYAAAVLGLDISSRRFASGFFDKDGIPKAVVESDQQINQEQARTIKDRIMANLTGRDPLVLGLGLKYTQIQVRPDESQFLATQQASVAQICRYFGVPAGMIDGPSGGSMCVDTETEMLTTKGWLRYDQIQSGDMCLTLNTETGLAEWQPVDAIYVFGGPHEMLRMHSSSHSSFTTLNHRWPVRREGDAEITWRESQTMVSSDRVLAAAPVANLPTEPKWSDALVELAAWFYTEGWIGRYGEVRIAQSHVVNPEHCARIRGALTEVFGPECTERHVRARPTWIAGRYGESKVTHFRLNKRAARVLLDLAPDKVPSPEFLTQLTRAQLELFISTSIDADGSTTNTGTPVLVQKDIRRVEAFQIACALAGKSGVIRQNQVGHHAIGIRQNIHRKPKGHNEHVTRMWTSGPVWCPTTANRTWFARRDGTAYFTGNTYTNTEQRGLEFVTYSLSHWLRRIEDAVFRLLPGTQYVQFNAYRLIRLDAETQAKVDLQRLAGKIIAPSEIRSRDGLDPMTDAQKREADMVPLTVGPLGRPVGQPALHDPVGPEAPVPTSENPTGA